MLSLTLLLSLFLPNLDQVNQLILENRYSEASHLLNFINDGVDYNNYHYYRLICNYAQNDLGGVLTELNRLDNTFFPFTRRQTTLIYLIKEDIKNWTDGLDDISREMNRSRDRLKNIDPHQETQKIQKKIVDKLDEYIKELENPPGNPKNPPKNGDQSGKPLPNPGSSPLDESKIMGGTGKGDLDKIIKNLNGQWGGLPPQERAKVIQEITRDVPVKYKSLWDSYIKSLNKVR